MNGPILLNYQRKPLASTAMVRVVEKSRRVGLSWCFASEAATTAAAEHGAGDDVLYVGYNLDMAREFIDDCAFWAKHLAGFAAEIEGFDYNDVLDKDERDIKAFRITFASGYKILALSSRPRSLRGRQGLVIIDEAAFHDDLQGLLKAAFALLIWGGRVVVISTHFGEDNPFNDLVQDIREGRKPHDLYRITFDEAIEQGLYKRICLVTGKEWSIDAQKSWVAEIREFYGDDAAEELDCVPSQGSGVYLTRAMIEACMSAYAQVARLKCEPGFEQRPDHERRSYVDAWLEEFVDPLLKELDPSLRTCFGEDFGRSGDLTVIVPIQIEQTLKRRVPFVVELRNTPFREQEQILFHIISRLPKFTAGKMDARGNGQFLAEVAAQKFGAARIEQVMASIAWYMEHMPRMKAAFEDQTISVPRDADLMHDLRMIAMEKGVAKVPDNARHKGQDGGQRHGDFAIACCMAYAATLENIAPIEFQSSGTARVGLSAYELGADQGSRTSDRGFGTVRGHNDFRGY